MKKKTLFFKNEKFSHFSSPDVMKLLLLTHHISQSFNVQFWSACVKRSSAACGAS